MRATIAEELLLLRLDDEDGKKRGDSTKMGFGVVGAHLLELGLAGRVELEGKKIAVRGDSPVGEAATDEVLQALTEAKRPATPHTWMSKLSSKSTKATMESLVDKGFVHEEERKVLGLFPGKRYPAADDSAEADARRRLRTVLIEGQRPDARTAALVGMVHATGLAKSLFPESDGKEIAKRAKEIAESGDDLASDAVTKTVAAVSTAVQTAVMAAVGGSGQ
ncbi:Golgi phosphoprotein 3 GPP34 [Tamaricihabitans halophyticus]|uniref:Golgi phosphoprotein 3 GPP34 n=1 Tax=Tamaricihabitans halophyticus TaxID=1262583 RepID=A0A4R2QZL6_9PSEU|nr:GPP34 family phosphoprotein [Tamaricihabitans halophyticus]TCP54834.1 Golgi phosphoprotein 3 GPP34 [Tamaricihabitans halophyticus]